ncbi:hypothetical protein KKA33_02740 [Patescibacteria group bacterium]|nr:hypothetical protein [Patescibacteria group bacterium]
MSQETPPHIDEIRALAKQCQAIIDETKKQDTHLSYARRCEFRNIKAALGGLLEYPELFFDKARGMLEEIRQRVQDLIDHPESAGHHDHVLQEKKWES